MTKPINQDVVGFKDDFFKGLSFRETVFGALALSAGVGGIIFFYFYLHIPLNLAITICMPVIAFIGLCGFYHKNNMTLMQIIKAIIRLHKTGSLVYVTRRKNEPQKSCIEPDPEIQNNERSSP